MATYYVSKSGNDTTGDGSQGNPWLTIAKAKNTISIAGNHTVNIGAGTYAENEGAGYMVLNRQFVAPVVFQSESGTATDVIITSASGAWNLFQNSVFTNFTFKDLTIQARTGTSCFNYNQSLNFSGLLFENVVFIADGTGASLACIREGSNTPSGVITQSMRFINPTFKASGGTSGWAIRGALHASAPTGSVLNIYIDGGRSDDGTLSTGIEAGPGCNIDIDGGRWKGTAGKGVLIAADLPASGLKPTTGRINGAYIESSTGHAFLIGGNSQNVQAFGCVIRNGDHAAVVKSCTNPTFRHNVCEAGTLNALLIKGATGGTFKYNILRSELNGADAAFAQSDTGGTTYLNTDWTADRNLVIMVGPNSKAIRWEPTEDGGGCVLNNTVWHDRRTDQTLSWGQVLADTDVRSPEEIHAAFAAGGEPGNETSEGAPIRMFNYRHSATGSVLYALIYDQNGSIYSADGFVVPRPTETGFLSRCTIPMYEETPYMYEIIWPVDIPAGTYSVQVYSQSEYGLPAVADTLLGQSTQTAPDLATAIKGMEIWGPLIYSSMG